MPGLSGDLSYAVSVGPGGSAAGAQLGVSDLLMAQLITSMADTQSGNPALLLQQLLGYGQEDYGELRSALSESGCR